MRPLFRLIIPFAAVAILAVAPLSATAVMPTLGKSDRFQDVPALTPEKLPVTGPAHPKLAPVDAAISKFLAGKGIPAASFAVSKGGQILHSRAFGWADASLTKPLQPGMSMRLASITKPITRAAIQTLLDAGQLKGTDHVFDVLELGKLPVKKLDPRWKEITVQQLLEHRGGWDRAISGDFTFKSKAIADELKVPLKQLQPAHLVRWALERPLDFDPGAREVYSNFGYILLARVVEKKSGRPFLEYVKETVGKTAGLTTLMVSRSDPEDRLPGEIWYCLHPEYRRPENPLTLRCETKDGSGALACSAEDYCRFLEHYSIIGKPRIPGGTYLGTFFGSMPGSTSACSQRADGICYTIICNRRDASAHPEAWNQELKTVIDTALDPIAPGL